VVLPGPEKLADGISEMHNLRPLPAAQNKDMSVYPAPSERIEAVRKVIVELGR
jgi:hypothetical protein